MTEDVLKFILQSSQRHVQKKEQPRREKVNGSQEEAWPVCVSEGHEESLLKHLSY